MTNPQWLKLPMSRINFHGPKDVRAIEILLYVVGMHYKYLAEVILICAHSMFLWRTKDNNSRIIIKSSFLKGKTH